MNKPQIWTLIGVFAAGMFGTIALMSTMFVRMMQNGFDGMRKEFRSEFAGVRTEFRSEFAAVRTEMRDESAALRTEMRNGDEETRRYMRVLFEEYVGRMKVIGKAGARRRNKSSRKKSGA